MQLLPQAWPRGWAPGHWVRVGGIGLASPTGPGIVQPHVVATRALVGSQCVTFNLLWWRVRPQVSCGSAASPHPQALPGLLQGVRGLCPKGWSLPVCTETCRRGDPGILPDRRARHLPRRWMTQNQMRSLGRGQQVQGGDPGVCAGEELGFAVRQYLNPSVLTN